MLLRRREVACIFSFITSLYGCIFQIDNHRELITPLYTLHYILSRIFFTKRGPGLKPAASALTELSIGDTQLIKHKTKWF